MSTVKIFRRGKIEEVGADEILNAAAAATGTLVDLGTGDGKFPYRMAKENPGLFCIGIDPAQDNLRESSAKIGRKPARGGVNNLAYIVSALDTIPESFSGIADRVTVNFPWGTLLKGLVRPEDDSITVIRNLLKTGGDLDILLNMQVFDDAALCERLDLPEFDEGYVDRVLIPAYRKHGLIVHERTLLEPGELPERTSWGRHLSVGSGRTSMMIKARK